MLNHTPIVPRGHSLSENFERLRGGLHHQRIDPLFGQPDIKKSTYPLPSPPMTVCIAALCQDGKAVVLAADRQITAPGLNLEFEHADSKIEGLGDCLVMAAADSLLAAEVVERARGSVVVGNYVRETAQRLRDAYMAIHLERAESVILRPRGFTFQEFKERALQIPPQAYSAIDSLLFGFGIGVVEFLVAGLDVTGAHIFRVHYDGMAGGDWLEWQNRIGYRAIGSGSSHAGIFLAIGNQHRGLSAEQTVYHVYCAKRLAEAAPGVGRATDIILMMPSGRVRVDARGMEKLEAIRRETQKDAPTLANLSGIMPSASSE